MKRFFSHLPAWVEASAAGSSRASANIRAMACSAVVIELPNGVFITTTPLRGRGRDVDIVDADAGAADTLRLVAASSSVRGHLGRRADGEAVIVADDRLQLVLARGRASRRPRRRWRGRSRRPSDPSGRRSALWAFVLVSCEGVELGGAAS